MARSRALRRRRGPRRRGGGRLTREELLRIAYRAFNARDIESALALMDAGVDWPNGMEGGRVRGREAVREYWERQFAAIDSRVDPIAFDELPDGRLSVRVHQRVRDVDGRELSDGEVRHVYKFRDGAIARMDIEH